MPVPLPLRTTLWFARAARGGAFLFSAGFGCGALGAATPLRLDPTYAPQVLAHHAALRWVSLTPAPDGRFLVSGQFEFLDGAPASGLARLTADGARDATFNYAGPVPNPADPVVPLADGRVLTMRARFEFEIGLTGQLIERFLENGTRDPAFATLRVDGGTANRAHVTARGIVLTGGISTIAGQSREGIARLLADGTLDATFAPTLGGPGTIVLNSVLTDGGDVVVWHVRQTGSAIGDPAFARIRADGTVDPSFHPSGVAGPVLAAVRGGKILVASPSLVRLHVDGAIDPTFVADLRGLRDIAQILEAPDGRVLVGGVIDTGGAAIPTVVILSANGAFEADLRNTFDAGRVIELLGVSSTGEAIVRHGLTGGMEIRRPLPPPFDLRFSLVHVSTLVERDFTPDAAVSGNVENLTGIANNRVFVSGSFDRFDGHACPGLVRLLPDGAFDQTFAAPANPAGYRLALPLPDGRALVYDESLQTVDYAPLIVRLRADGSLDPTLAPDSALALSGTRVHAVEPDGRVIASRSRFGDGAHADLELYRFNADGSLAGVIPTHFAGPPGLQFHYAWDVHAYGDGRLLLAGAFSLEGAGTLIQLGFRRLLADGTLDPGYAPAIDSASDVQGLDLLADGSALAHIAHPNSRFYAPDVLRFRPDGTQDPEWYVTRDDARRMQPTLFEQRDDSFFARSLGTDRLSRWFADGSPDLNLDVPPGVHLQTAVTQSDRTVLLGGAFSLVAGQPRIGLARLVPVASPGFTATPQPQTVVAGRDLVLQAAIGDADGALFIWEVNGVRLLSRTGARLVLRNVTAAQAGTYRVTAITRTRTYVSDAVTVTIVPSLARLANFSARSRVRDDRPPQIAGFITRPGTAPRPVLLRAIGRGLANSGVWPWSLLGRPELALFDGASELARDRGSARRPEIRVLAQRVGAFDPSLWTPVPGILANHDSALAPTLGGGAFTAQITRDPSVPDNVEGISLFEFYDTSDIPQPGLLLNVSLRGRTAPGVDTMIGGFVIAGEGPLTLLLRAVGPELAPWGVADVLADPQLTVYDRHLPIAGNDDWSSQAAPGPVTVEFATAATGAFPLEPASKSAALVATLEPGAYTVHATGADGTSGEVLLELYVVEE